MNDSFTCTYAMVWMSYFVTKDIAWHGNDEGVKNISSHHKKRRRLQAPFLY